MRTTRIKDPQRLQDSLRPPYNYFVQIACHTGLRVSDVLRLRVGQLKQKHYYITEKKAGKKREIYLPKKIRENMLKYALRHGFKDNEFFFQSKQDSKKHITRQTIWRQIKKASTEENMSGNIAPHSCRKHFAYKTYIRKNKNIQKVQKTMKHSNIADTVLYLID